MDAEPATRRSARSRGEPEREAAADPDSPVARPAGGAQCVTLALKYPRQLPGAGVVRQVELWVAPDARPRELRAVLLATLKLPETAELKLLRVDAGGRASPAVLSAGLLLADAAALLLDCGAPPPAPSWRKLHMPQLLGCASIAAYLVMPPPLSALPLLSLAAASALIAPPGGGGLAAQAAPTAALLVTAHAFDALQLYPAAMPAPMAALGFYCALAAALFRMRVLLINIAIMLGQLALLRAIAWEGRIRKAAAPPPAAPRR